MRLPELMFLLFLFLACVGSNTVARKTFIVSNLLDGAKKKSTNEGLDDANKCKNKRLQLSHYSCSKKNTTTSDDKRVVPTGPNPLHNREKVASEV